MRSEIMKYLTLGTIMYFDLTDLFIETERTTLVSLIHKEMKVFL